MNGIYDPADEFWPGAWRRFDSGMTRLESFKNDEHGQIIRVSENPTTGELKAFVHIGNETIGTAWTEGELLEMIRDYMEAHP